MDHIQREQRWREICREYHESGMTRKAFSESRGVARSYRCAMVVALNVSVNPSRMDRPAEATRNRAALGVELMNKIG